MAKRYKKIFGNKSKAKSIEQPVEQNQEQIAEEKPKKKQNKLLLNILLGVFALVFVVSAYMLVDEVFIKKYQNDKLLSDFENEIEDILGQLDGVDPEINSIPSSSGSTENTESSEAEEPEEYKDYTQAIIELQEKYPDLTGWITVDNTVIKYPVMKSSPNNPEYYLKRDYKGNYSGYGSIFYDKNSDAYSTNQIMHGHNMLNGSMFAAVEKYDSLDFYKQAPTINYDTYLQPGTYKIISVFKTNVLKSQGEIFNYFQSDFSTGEDKMNFIYNVMNRSLIDTGVDVNVEDTFITLSTCSYELDQFRSVVVARKVREGEDPTVDVSQATLRSNVLYPDAWYNKFGGRKPVLPDTFAQAQAQGLTDWWYFE